MNSIITKIEKMFFYDSCDINNTIFIAGTGRSGTTWLENLVNCDQNFRIMFEPFNNIYVKHLRNWHHRQYIRPQEENVVFKKDAEKILSGDIRNQWIDRYNKKRIVSHRLVKDIRAHLSLKWIHTNFPQIPIVYLLRHPCAIAKSKLEQNWQTDLSVFLRQDNLIDDYLYPFLSDISSAKTDFEKHIFLWCIENYVPLKQFKDKEMLIVFYEDICNKPITEVNRISKYLKIDFKGDIREAISRPSELSQKTSAVVQGGSLLSSWRRSISQEQIKDAVDICKLFGLNAIYDESDMPKMSPDLLLEKFQ